MRARGEHAVGPVTGWRSDVADAYGQVQERLGLSVEAQFSDEFDRELTHHRRRGVHAECACLERGFQPCSDPPGRAGIAVLAGLAVSSADDSVAVYAAIRMSAMIRSGRSERASLTAA